MDIVVTWRLLVLVAIPGRPERMRNSALLIATVTFLHGCAIQPEAGVRFCENDSYQIEAKFEAGNFYSCSINRSGAATLIIRPENEPPINQSPWYAFRVNPKEPGAVSITLEYVNGYARYWPKVSLDGIKWQPMDEARVTRSDDRNSMTLRLLLDENTVWVAGQPLITTTYYDEWMQDLSMHDAIETSVLGHSVQGRAIGVARTASKPEVVFFIGRQHPPEVTGALAMKPFVDTVLGDSMLARQFRDRYMVVIIPLLNPDGVVLGHWRHNVNGRGDYLVCSNCVSGSNRDSLSGANSPGVPMAIRTSANGDCVLTNGIDRARPC